MNKKLWRDDWRVHFFLIVVLVLADQLLKFWARAELIGAPEANYLGGLVVIVHAENSGAFLSLGADWPIWLRTLLFVVVVAIYLVYALYMMFFKNPHWLFRTGLGLLVAGGIGNLIDRVDKGSVTDYIMLTAGPLRTGVFNLADFVIVLGVLLLIFEPKDSKATEAKSTQPTS